MELKRDSDWTTRLAKRMRSVKPSVVFRDGVGPDFLFIDDYAMLNKSHVVVFFMKRIFTVLIGSRDFRTEVFNSVKHV